MKKLIVCALIAACLFGLDAGAAVKQSSINLPSFRSLKVSGSFAVSLVRGSDFRALVSVEEAYTDYIICTVKDNVLNLEIDERRVPSEVKRQFRGKGSPDPVFSAVIYVPELVQSVTLTDKSVLHNTDDVFDKSKVVFELKDNASVKSLDLSSQEVRISLQNKSMADFKISCKQLDAQTANSSFLSMDETSAESVYSLYGSSKIIAKSRGTSVTVNTKNNATMTLVGSADTVSYNLSGTSEVNAVDFEVPDAKVTMTSVCTLSEAAYRNLTLNLNGGSTLYFYNDPQVRIESIKSSTVSRMDKDSKSSSKI